MKNLLYALTFAFILLKVTGYIDWSWWLVLSPIIGLAVLIIFLVAITIWAELIEERKPKPRKSKFESRITAYVDQLKQSKSTHHEN